MKTKTLILSLLLCALGAQARTLTIINKTPDAFWVWMASPPPRQSFAFTYVEPFASVHVDIDAFEYRTIGDISRPCSPLTGPGTVWFAAPSFTIEAPVNWDRLREHARLTVTKKLELILKRQ